MNFLLDPNVAYLILLGGVLLGLLAIVTPGTGMLEVGAFFCLVLAGYAVYNLSFNWWAIAILLLSLVPFIYSIQKPKRELFLGLAILLLVVGSVFIFPLTNKQSSVNPFLAIISSGLVAGFIWIAVRKSLEAVHAKSPHNLDELIGQTGEAKTEIFKEGSVYVLSELWSARSDGVIPAGSSISVVKREGFMLVVEKSNSSKT